jgi:hypothetical protein
VSRPGVSKLQIEDLPTSGMKWPPFEKQHCLEGTRFLLKAKDLSALLRCMLWQFRKEAL